MLLALVALDLLDLRIDLVIGCFRKSLLLRLGVGVCAEREDVRLVVEMRVLRGDDWRWLGATSDERLDWCGWRKRNSHGERLLRLHAVS